MMTMTVDLHVVPLTNVQISIQVGYYTEALLINAGCGCYNKDPST